MEEKRRPLGAHPVVLTWQDPIGWQWSPSNWREVPTNSRVGFCLMKTKLETGFDVERCSNFDLKRNKLQKRGASGQFV